MADDQEHDDIKALRTKAGLADAADKARADAQRELAFVKAGIDTDVKLNNLWMQAYEGEMDRESILAAAKTDGVLKEEAPPAPPAPPAGATPQQLEEQRVRDQLAAGASPTQGDADVNPYENALGLGFAARKDGFSEERQYGFALNALLAAGVKGDQRVIES